MKDEIKDTPPQRIRLQMLVGFAALVALAATTPDGSAAEPRKSDAEDIDGLRKRLSNRVFWGRLERDLTAQLDAAPDLLRAEIPDGFAINPLRLDDLESLIFGVIGGGLLNMLDPLTPSPISADVIRSVVDDPVVKPALAEECLMPGHPNWFSYGVTHDREGFQIDGARILQAIKESGVVLLESGSYFDTLAEYAKSKGKEVRYIDYSRFQLGLVTFTALAFLVKLIVFQKKRGQSLLATPEIIRKLLALPVSDFTLVGYRRDLFRLSKQRKSEIPDGIPGQMRSFVVDGRTIIMLRNAIDAVTAEPNKKFLSLVGANHANDFVVYLRHPDLFRIKLAFWNICAAGALVRGRQG